MATLELFRIDGILLDLRAVQQDFPLFVLSIHALLLWKNHGVPGRLSGASDPESKLRRAGARNPGNNQLSAEEADEREQTEVPQSTKGVGTVGEEAQSSARHRKFH